MSAEGWTNSESQFGSRNFSNSNYRGGQRREGGGGGGGGNGYYQGSRPAYNGVNGQNPRSGGYGQQPTFGGRQYYGQRQQTGGGQFNGQPRYNNFQNGASSKIDIESNKVGMVIGRGGGKIREIQDNFNVHVRIDRDPGVNGLTGVTIRGEEASIQLAKDFIEDLVAVK